LFTTLPHFEVLPVVSKLLEAQVDPEDEPHPEVGPSGHGPQLRCRRHL